MKIKCSVPSMSFKMTPMPNYKENIDKEQYREPVPTMTPEPTYTSSLYPCVAGLIAVPDSVNKEFDDIPDSLPTPVPTMTPEPTYTSSLYPCVTGFIAVPDSVNKEFDDISKFQEIEEPPLLPSQVPTIKPTEDDDRDVWKKVPVPTIAIDTQRQIRQIASEVALNDKANVHRNDSVRTPKPSVAPTPIPSQPPTPTILSDDSL